MVYLKQLSENHRPGFTEDLNFNLRTVHITTKTSKKSKNISPKNAVSTVTNQLTVNTGPNLSFHVSERYTVKRLRAPTVFYVSSSLFPYGELKITTRS